MKKKLLFSIGVLSMASLLVACSSGKKATTTKDSASTETAQTLRVLENAELPTMDLSLATDVVSFSAISQVMEGLYEFADDSTAQPAMAKEVVEPTNDGKTYTIPLREDAKWSNGDPVTAHDFVFSWQRTVNPATGGEYAYLFDGFANFAAIQKGEKDPSELGVKALDDYTLEITLDYSIPYLNSILAKPFMYPLNEKFVTEKGKDYGTNSDNVLYNGAFTLADWDGTNVSWKYLKNENFHDADNVKLDEIDVTVSKEDATNVNLFHADDVDVVQIKGEFVEQELENPELVTRIYPSTSYLQYNFDNEVLKNKNIRQAFNHIIDSEVLTSNILKDGSLPIRAFVPQGIVNSETGKDFNEEAGELMTLDEKEAQKYWQAGLKELGKDKVELTLLTSDTDSAKKISEFIQGVLTENFDGLTVNVSNVPFKNRLDAMSKQDFDFVLAGWAATFSDPVDFLQLVQGDNSMNYGKFNNAEFDKLLNDASVTYATDNGKRWEALLAAQDIFMEEVAMTPIYQSSETFLVKERVQGLKYRALGSPYYKNVSIVE